MALETLNNFFIAMRPMMMMNVMQKTAAFGLAGHPILANDHSMK